MGKSESRAQKGKAICKNSGENRGWEISDIPYLTPDKASFDLAPPCLTGGSTSSWQMSWDASLGLGMTSRSKLPRPEATFQLSASTQVLFLMNNFNPILFSI